MALHYEHFSRAEEGSTDLVLAKSVCVRCVGKGCVCVCGAVVGACEISVA